MQVSEYRRMTIAGASPEDSRAAIQYLTESLRVFNAAALANVRPFNGFHFRLMLDEALLNANEHGCRNVANPRIELTVRFSDASIEVTIEDPGNGFSFAEHMNKQDVHFDEIMQQGIRRAKGWGLVVMRSLTQGIFFNPLGNRITLLLRRPV